MRYCEKCNKEVKPGQETYRGLCLKCYEDYLLKKIELHEANQCNKTPSPPSKSYLKEALEGIKRFFQKKKKGL